MKARSIKNLINSKAPVVLVSLFYLAFLPACGHHQPAPVEDYSTVSKKRHLNSDSTYTVRQGDTLYAIAFNYGMDPQNLARWNEIVSPYVIYPGQKLTMLAPPAGSRTTGSSSGVQISKLESPARATTKTVSEPSSKPPAKSKPASTTATASKAPKPAPAPVTGNADPESWKWPTNGRVLRTYVAGNPARNGLDIAGKEGQPVIASSAGQVVYSGNGLIGYGELIIIKHSEKMLSAYAYNKVRLVKEGEKVSGGQKIAEMGRNAENEQVLHFEIRAHGKPVNPLIYLPKK